MKEHSIHYQTFNAHQILELLRILERFDYQSSLVDRARKIIFATRTFLPYCIKPNGQYHLIGDTFQRPVERYLTDFSRYCHAKAPERFAPHKKSLRKDVLPNCLVVAPNAGFAAIRYKYGPDKKIDVFHLFFTASWHSEVHKQNDDLSFTLFLDGDDIVGDPGYTDLPEAKALDYRSELRHNTVTSQVLPWTSRLGRPGGTRIVRYHASAGLGLLQGEHRRIPGVLVRRTIAFVEPCLLFVIDQILSKEPGPFSQRYSFGRGVDVKRSSDQAVTLDRPGKAPLQFEQISGSPSDTETFENFVVEDLGFRASGAKLIPVTGVSFSARGDRLIMAQALYPGDHPGFAFGAPFVELEGDDGVTIEYTLNGSVVRKTATLVEVSGESGFFIKEI